MTNRDEILRAVAEYRAACDAVQPAWDHMISTPVYCPETPARREARDVYVAVQQRVRDARKRLIEAALDGRSEVPR